MVCGAEVLSKDCDRARPCPAAFLSREWRDSTCGPGFYACVALQRCPTTRLRFCAVRDFLTLKAHRGTEATPFPRCPPGPCPLGPGRRVPAERGWPDRDPPAARPLCPATRPLHLLLPSAPRRLRHKPTFSYSTRPPLSASDCSSLMALQKPCLLPLQPQWGQPGKVLISSSN